jgi:hypothetical protein
MIGFQRIEASFREPSTGHVGVKDFAGIGVASETHREPSEKREKQRKSIKNWVKSAACKSAVGRSHICPRGES